MTDAFYTSRTKVIEDRLQELRNTFPLDAELDKAWAHNGLLHYYIWL
jgi:hypothetical protein